VDELPARLCDSACLTSSGWLGITVLGAGGTLDGPAAIVNTMHSLAEGLYGLEVSNFRDLDGD
jgi:hypothetical protein